MRYTHSSCLHSKKYQRFGLVPPSQQTIYNSFVTVYLWENTESAVPLENGSRGASRSPYRLVYKTHFSFPPPKPNFKSGGASSAKVWAKFRPLEPRKRPHYIMSTRQYETRRLSPLKARGLTPVQLASDKSSPERFSGHFRKYWKFGSIEPAHVDMYLVGGGGKLNILKICQNHF